MANNYDQGATFVPAECLAPGGAQAAAEILLKLAEILESDERPVEYDDFYEGCLNVEPQSDGSLYISSGDEFFCFASFEYLIESWQNAI